MKLKEIMIVWTPALDFLSDYPTKEKVAVIPYPDRNKQSRFYRYAVGACFDEWKNMDDEKRIQMMFVEFNTLVVRDKIDPQLAHKSFLVIEEYRKYIAPDMEGAD